VTPLVGSQTVRVRDLPGGSQIVAAIPAGTVVQVLFGRSVVDGIEWLQIRLPSGRVGWVAGYLLTLDLLVGAGWFRDLVLGLPFGDVYLHNPGRLRYLIVLVVPVLGALGLQSFLDRLPAGREAADGRNKG